MVEDAMYYRFDCDFAQPFNTLDEAVLSAVESVCRRTNYEMRKSNYSVAEVREWLGRCDGTPSWENGDALVLKGPKGLEGYEILDECELVTFASVKSVLEGYLSAKEFIENLNK